MSSQSNLIHLVNPPRPQESRVQSFFIVSSHYDNSSLLTPDPINSIQKPRKSHLIIFLGILPLTKDRVNILNQDNGLFGSSIE